MKVEVSFSEIQPAQLDEMLVMREKEDLRAFGKLRELRQNCRGSGVIESDKQVIENERHRLVIFQMTIQRGDAEREVELIPCAFAHSVHWDIRSVRPAPFEHRDVLLIKFRGEPIESASGDLAEYPPRSLKQRALVFLAESLDLHPQKMRSKPESDKPRGVLLHSRRNRFRLLAEIRRGITGFGKFVALPI